MFPAKGNFQGCTPCITNINPDKSVLWKNERAK